MTEFVRISSQASKATTDRNPASDPLLHPEMSYKIGTLQVLGDAITYRLDRLKLAVPGLRAR